MADTLLGNLVWKIVGDSRDFDKSMEKTVKGFVNVAAKSLTLMTTLIALKNGFVSTIKEAAKIEDMVAAFTPLTGNAKNAKNMIAALNKEAATTPFELEGIGKVAKQLLPILGNDVAAVTKTFRMLGDTAGGNIEKLDSITRGYVKTLSTGKVGMEALNMISDAGVPIQAQLAKSMGITVEQLYTLSSAGKVSSGDLTKAFEAMTSSGGIFFDGMNIASQTLNGKLSSMNDAVKMVGVGIGNFFLPAAKGAADAVAFIAGGLLKVIKRKTGVGELTVATDELTTASNAYKTAVNELNTKSGTLSKTEEGLLKNRKEMAALDIKTALNSLSTGYDNVSRKIKEADNDRIYRNKQLEASLKSLSDIETAYNRQSAEQKKQAKGTAYDLENRLVLARQSAEDYNKLAIEADTKLITLKTDQATAITSIAQAYKDGIINIDIYRTTNKALYDEIVKVASGIRNVAPAIKTVTPVIKETGEESEDAAYKAALLAEKLAAAAEAERNFLMTGDEMIVQTQAQSLETNLLAAGMGDYQKSLEDNIKAQEDFKESLINMGLTGALSSIGDMTEALVLGEDGWAAFAKSGLLAIASIMDAIGAQIVGYAALEIARAGFFNPAGWVASAYQLTQAAAAFGSAGIIRGLAANFENGGIVPGNSMSGDNVPANVNSKEMILTQAQQKTLFDIANGGGSGGNTSIVIQLDGKTIADSTVKLVNNGQYLIKAGSVI